MLRLDAENWKIKTRRRCLRAFYRGHADDGEPAGLLPGGDAGREQVACLRRVRTAAAGQDGSEARHRRAAPGRDRK